MLQVLLHCDLVGCLVDVAAAFGLIFYCFQPGVEISFGLHVEFGDIFDKTIHQVFIIEGERFEDDSGESDATM